MRLKRKNWWRFTLFQSYSTTSERIAKFLDMLPARGPDAFDQFCEVLLECDHTHVAEYLKTLEGKSHN